MAYYVVVNFDVTNPEMYGKYVQAVVPNLMQYGAKILVADSETKDLDGKSRHTLVVLEFESEAATMHWYNSPEYQAIIRLRLDATTGWLRGAPQFVKPGA